MKSLLTPIMVLIILGIFTVIFLSVANTQKMIVVIEGNSEKKPLEIELGRFQDSDCGMIIEDISFASQVVAPSGKTVFFHDHGGMVNWLKDKSFRDSAVIWVYTLDSKRWVDGKSAYYSLDESTPMNYGFGAYENSTPKRVGFEEMSRRMLNGETLNNPKTRALILGDR